MKVVNFQYGFLYLADDSLVWEAAVSALLPYPQALSDLSAYLVSKAANISLSSQEEGFPLPPII